jgi:hypothetical protein
MAVARSLRLVPEYFLLILGSDLPRWQTVKEHSDGKFGHVLVALTLALLMMNWKR